MGDLDQSQGHLFSEAENKNLFFVTNTRNLLSILGSGMIVPAQHQFRYKTDSRESLDGVIPLWRGGPPSGQDIDSDSNLAIIEFSEKQVFDQLAKGIIAQQQNVVAYHGPIPVNLISAIRLQNEDAINDFLIRAPEDVIADKDLFSEIKPSQLVEPIPLPSIDSLEELSTTLNVMDRFGGALKALDYIEGRDAPVFDYAHLLTEVCVSRFGLSGPGKADSQATDEDLRIVEILLEYLSDARPEDRLDLDGLQRRFEETTGDSLTEDTMKWLQFSRKVIEAEREVPVLSDSGDIIKRGALLFFLRPDLDRLKASVDSSIAPGPSVLTVAAFLAGFYTGYARMGPELKGNFAAHGNYAAMLLKALYLNAGGTTERFTHLHNEGADSQLVVNEVEVWSRAVQPHRSLAFVQHKAGLHGYELAYDYEEHVLKYELQLESGRRQLVYIEPIIPIAGREEVVRFFSPCIDLSGSKKRTLTKAVAEKLLIWNSQDDMYCSFSYSEKRAAIVVKATQIVDTMDKSEFITLMKEVASIADQYQQGVASKMKGSE